MKHTNFSLVGWSARYLLTLLLGLCTATIAMAEDLDPEEGSQTVTLFADTNLINPSSENFVQARSDNVSLAGLENLSLVTKDGVNIFNLDETKKVEVTLFIPAEMDPVDEKAFIDEISARLNKRYNHVVFNVQRAYIPVDQFNQVAQSLALEDEQAASAVTIAGHLKAWSLKTKTLARMLRMKIMLPETRDLTIQSIAAFGGGVGGIIAFAKSTGFNFYGYSQMALWVFFGFVNNIYPIPINKFKVNHQIPWFKKTDSLDLEDSQPKWRRAMAAGLFAPLEKGIEFYNSQPLVRTMVFNSLYSFLIGGSLNQFGHWYNPGSPDNPPTFSKKFLKETLLIAPIQAPLQAAGDIGVFNLMRKGYISKTTSTFIYNGFGLWDLFNFVKLTAEKKDGNKALYFTSLGTQLAVRTVIWGVSKWLPAKQNRIIILHPNLSDIDRSQIEYTKDLRDVVLNKKSVTQSTLEEILERDGLKSSAQQDEGERTENLIIPVVER